MNMVPIISAMLHNNQRRNERSNFTKEMEKNAFDYSYLINEDGKAEPLEAFCDEETLAMFERIDKGWEAEKKKRKRQEVIAVVVAGLLLVIGTLAWMAPV